MNFKIITNINNIDKKKWANFVKNNVHGNIFQSPEIYEVYQKTKNYEPIFIALLSSDDEILGLLLAVIQKEHSGVAGIFSSRAIVWGGPLTKDKKLTILDTILRKYNKIVKKNAIFSQFRNLWKWQDKEKAIFEKYNFKYEEHLDIINNLQKTEKELWSSFKSEVRTNVRKAKRNDVLFYEISNFEELESGYKLLKKIYNSRIKKPLPHFSYFYNIYTLLSNKDYAGLYLAKVENTVAGFAVRFFYDESIYALFAVSDRQFSKYKIQDFMNYKILNWGINNNFKIFDFGGAGKPGDNYGVRKYKMKFGGKLVNFGRFTKIHKPLLMQLGKILLIFWEKLR